MSYRSFGRDGMSVVRGWAIKICGFNLVQARWSPVYIHSKRRRQQLTTYVNILQNKDPILRNVFDSKEIDQVSRHEYVCPTKWEDDWLIRWKTNRIAERGRKVHVQSWENWREEKAVKAFRSFAPSNYRKSEDYIVLHLAVAMFPEAGIKVFRNEMKQKSGMEAIIAKWKIPWKYCFHPSWETPR